MDQSRSVFRNRRPRPLFLYNNDEDQTSTNDIERTKENSSMERLLKDQADVAKAIFAFLPPGYRYVAGVSRTLRKVYLGPRCRSHRGKTCVEWAVTSPQTAAIFVRECCSDDDNKKDNNQIVTRHKACTYAARYGRLATLRWLRDETVHDPLLPWDLSTLLAAAAYASASSSGECLVYAVDHGCPGTTFAGGRRERVEEEEQEQGQDPPYVKL